VKWGLCEREVDKTSMSHDTILTLGVEMATGIMHVGVNQTLGREGSRRSIGGEHGQVLAAGHEQLCRYGPSLAGYAPKP